MLTAPSTKLLVPPAGTAPSAAAAWSQTVRPDPAGRLPCCALIAAAEVACKPEALPAAEQPAPCDLLGPSADVADPQFWQKGSFKGWKVRCSGAPAVGFEVGKQLQAAD